MASAAATARAAPRSPCRFRYPRVQWEYQPSKMVVCSWASGMWATHLREAVEGVKHPDVGLVARVDRVRAGDNLAITAPPSIRAGVMGGPIM